jgi:hypothetical protein
MHHERVSTLDSKKAERLYEFSFTVGEEFPDEDLSRAVIDGA